MQKVEYFEYRDREETVIFSGEVCYVPPEGDMIDIPSHPYRRLYVTDHMPSLVEKPDGSGMEQLLRVRLSPYRSRHN